MLDFMSLAKVRNLRKGVSNRVDLYENYVSLPNEDTIDLLIKKRYLSKTISKPII